MITNVNRNVQSLSVKKLYLKMVKSYTLVNFYDWVQT